MNWRGRDHSRPFLWADCVPPPRSAPPRIGVPVLNGTVQHPTRLIAGTKDTYVSGQYAGSQAFVVTPTGIRFLDTPTGQNNHATAINDAGQVVGQVGGVGIAPQAILWSSDGSSLELNEFPNSYGSGIGGVNSINSQGQVVGIALTLDGIAEHAFLWIPGGRGMVDLNDLIDPASGWRLEQATGINDVDQIIGFGIFDGSERGFLLTPVSPVPLPPALPLIASGLVTLAFIGVSRRGRPEKV